MMFFPPLFFPLTLIGQIAATEYGPVYKTCPPKVNPTVSSSKYLLKSSQKEVGPVYFGAPPPTINPSIFPPNAFCITSEIPANDRGINHQFSRPMHFASPLRSLQMTEE